MTNYSADESRCRVSRFKKTGKWYDDFSIDMNSHYNKEDLRGAVASAILQVVDIDPDYIYICLEPYHRHSHPVMLKDRPYTARTGG